MCEVFKNIDCGATITAVHFDGTQYTPGVSKNEQITGRQADLG